MNPLTQFDTILLLRSLLSALVSVRVEGQENVPSTGGGIVVCNHTDFVDGVIQSLYTGRSLTFLAKAELTRLPDAQSLRSKLGDVPVLSLMEDVVHPVAKMVMDTSIVPISRNYKAGSAAAAHKYYEETKQKLISMIDAGRLLAIYPEGRRSPTGRLLPFRGLAARLALEARAPLIPTAIRGAFGLLSDPDRVSDGAAHSRSIVYCIGKPILPSEFPDGASKHAIKELTDRAQSQVELLLRGQRAEA